MGQIYLSENIPKTKKFRYILEYLALRAFSVIFLHLPYCLAIILGEILGVILCYFYRARFKIAIENICTALGYNRIKAKHLALESAKNLGRSLAEFLKYPKFSKKFLQKFITIHNEANLNLSLSQKKPVIFISGHFGNWELQSVILRLFFFPHLSVIAYRQHNILADKFINRYRRFHGIEIIMREESVNRLISILKKDKVLGIVADQDAGANGIFVDFFNIPTGFAKGPGVIAHRVDADVFFLSLVRNGRYKHTLYIDGPLEYRYSNSPKVNVRVLTTNWVKKLEETIRNYPDQWFWFHKRWTTKYKGRF